MGALQQALMMAGVIPGSDPYFSSVVALLHFDGTNGSTTITNSAVHGSTWTANGTAALDTSRFDRGTASVKFTGVNTSWISSTSSDYQIAADQDVTLEFSMNTATPTQDTYIMGDNGSPGANKLLIDTGSSNGLPYLLPNNINTPAGNANTANTWSQHCWQRSGAGAACIWRVFRMGVLLSTSSPSATFAGALNGSTFRIGTEPGGTFPYTGWIDEFRLTVGVARYTSSYTPAAFPDF